MSIKTAMRLLLFPEVREVLERRQVLEVASRQVPDAGGVGE
jgi:hypothetical protein